MNPELYPTLHALAAADPTANGYMQAGDDQALADWLNAPTSSYIWRSSVPTDEVFDAITWANLTPADAPNDTVAYTNRALLCQAKQINLQIILQGRERVACAKNNVRNGLSDALLNVPSGASGATQSAGWAAVKAVISRIATRAEAAISPGGTQGAPAVPAYEGTISALEASTVRVS